MTYRFPATKFVQENTMEEQADHVLSEAIEFAQAEGVDKLREGADVYHSLETLFRQAEEKYGREFVRDAIFGWIEKKNRERGYYPQRFGCHCEVPDGEEPDKCMIDAGRPWDCVLSLGLASKEQCSHWREIK